MQQRRSALEKALSPALQQVPMGLLSCLSKPDHSDQKEIMASSFYRALNTYPLLRRRKEESHRKLDADNRNQEIKFPWTVKIRVHRGRGKDRVN